MENRCGSVLNAAEESVDLPRSDSEAISKKRSGVKLDDKHKGARKLVKVKDLYSVLDSKAKAQFGKEEVSQVAEEPERMQLDASQVEKIERDPSLVVGNSALSQVDLNSDVCIANSLVLDENSRCADSLAFLRKHRKQDNKNCVVSKGIGLDLNAEDDSSSANQGSFHPCDHIQMKSMESSECGSTTGLLEVKDSLRIWKEMKQNGFISSSHAVLPMLKQRGRKTKTDALKKKIELAKKEQVDRFTRIAKPSGLLNDLNPGIINHVRNRKQVHSIIEAMVKSEKQEYGESGSKQTRHLKGGSKEVGDVENLNLIGTHQLSFHHKVGALNALSCGWETRGLPVSLNKPFPLIFEEKDGDGGSCMVEKLCGKSYASNSNPFSENSKLELKLSSSTNGYENASLLSNEESTNISSVSSLSVNAATVASQWLELLFQDIIGRLTALRRSKRRVQDVITTELPLLISKEFQLNQERDPYIMRKYADGFSKDETAIMHRARWTALFDQMDNSLSEEEKQLESWLNQVQEMQVHCEQGLQLIHRNAAYNIQQLGRSVKMDTSERELAIQAAAASIYSTCNFLSSKENLSCC